MKQGVMTNRNKSVQGPSGNGKSFFMNLLARQYYEQSLHVVLVGHVQLLSGLYEIIRRKTHGGNSNLHF